MIAKYVELEDEIRSILNSPENNSLIENTFKDLASRKVFIYGAGNMGRLAYKLLQEMGIDIEAFLDRRGGTDENYMNKPVYKADCNEISDVLKDNSLVIVAFLCGNKEYGEMQKWLGSLSFHNTCHYFILNNLVMTDKFIKTNNPVNTDILLASSFFKDEESKEVYRNFIKAVLTADSDVFSKPCDEPQYFVNDVTFQKGYSRFVDCGAFDGDTAIALMNYKGKAEAIALFEPEKENFGKLSINMRKNPVAREQILYPCGVWDRTEMLCFRSGIKTSSGISQDGDTFIQCVSLDDAIADFAPTFIKMDIEGAEYEALLGAETIIRKYKPDLAISVYHNIEHIWKIPILIESFVPEYEFSLRCHGLFGAETILYATCN